MSEWLRPEVIRPLLILAVAIGVTWYVLSFPTAKGRR